ncbi:hypothetical protein KR018_004087, partial [Drosophila ironensis]
MFNVIGVLLLHGLIAASQSLDKDVLQGHEFFGQARPLGLQFAEHFQNASLQDINIPIPGPDDLVCLADTTNLLSGVSSGQTWARKSELRVRKRLKTKVIKLCKPSVIDSWGSIPTGLLTGNSYSLGNFDECLSINQAIENSREIRGKYCFLVASSLRIATCLPASCSAAYMEVFVKQFIQKLTNTSIPVQISESSCQTSEGEPWDGLTIFTIVVISVMSAIVTLATLYDYFLCEDQSRVPVIVKIFSARANSRALFHIVDRKSNPNVIECLHGIRCMSLIWVIYSHEFIFQVKAPNINVTDVLAWVAEPFSSFVLHGFFSVDSFFVLGGLLVSMIVLRSMEKTNGKLNPLLMYLHRIIRILPVVAMAILIYMKMMNVVSGGPMMKSGYHGKEACEKGWFWTLLFIQNYAVVDICIDHTWYLAVDMQLYIISPLLLIAIYKWGKKAAAGIVVLIIMLSGCLFATQMVNKFSMLIKNTSDTSLASKKLYYATHVHAAPWLIGFLFGYFLHLNRGRKFHLSRLVVWSGWIISLALLFTSIFALYPAGKWKAAPISIFAESCYYTLTRLAWPLAICWIIFACMQGYGGLADSFLSHPLWQPLSRLSYSVYIWHMFVQEINIRNYRANIYFSNYQVILHFWLDFGVTLMMSYFLYLVIEAPLGGFDYLLRPQKVRPVEAQPRLLPEHSQDVETSKLEDQRLSEAHESSVEGQPKLLSEQSQ